MSLNLLALYPLPLGMERGVTHINLPVLLQRGCDELQSRTAHSPQDCETPPLLNPTVPTGEHTLQLCVASAAKKREVFILNHK